MALMCKEGKVKLPGVSTPFTWLHIDVVSMHTCFANVPFAFKTTDIYNVENKCCQWEYGILKTTALKHYQWNPPFKRNLFLILYSFASLVTKAVWQCRQTRKKLYLHKAPVATQLLQNSKGILEML